MQDPNRNIAYEVNATGHEHVSVREPMSEDDLGGPNTSGKLTLKTGVYLYIYIYIYIGKKRQGTQKGMCKQGISLPKRGTLNHTDHLPQVMHPLQHMVNQDMPHLHRDMQTLDIGPHLDTPLSLLDSHNITHRDSL